jgi:hypothetical protein
VLSVRLRVIDVEGVDTTDVTAVAVCDAVGIQLVPPETIQEMMVFVGVIPFARRMERRLLACEAAVPPALLTEVGVDCVEGVVMTGAGADGVIWLEATLAGLVPDPLVAVTVKV